MLMIKMVINSITVIIIMLDFYKFICAFNEFKGKITDTFIYMSALRINLLNI